MCNEPNPPPSYVAQNHDRTVEEVVAESEDEGLGASVLSSKGSSHGSQTDEHTISLVDNAFPQPPPTSLVKMASKAPLWISLW